MNIPIKKQKKQGRAPLSQTGKPTAAFSYYAGTKKTKESATTRTIMARERSGNFLDKLRLIPTVGAAIVILVSVLFSTTLTSVPNVQLVGAGSPYRDISVYRAESEKILKSSIMNKSKLTINTNKNEKILLGTFSELDVAQVGLPIIGRRPTITMHVRQPVLLLTTFSNAYVIDAAGKVVAEAGQLMSGIKDGLLTIQDQSGLNLRVGSQALTQESMVFISNVQAQFAAKKKSDNPSNIAANS